MGSDQYFQQYTKLEIVRVVVEEGKKNILSPLPLKVPPP